MLVTAALRRSLEALASHGREVPAAHPDAKVLLAQLRGTRQPPLPIPLEPNGPLAPLMAALRDDHSHQHRLQDWAACVALSPRTLRRRFEHAAGMSFGRWRRLARLRFALERLLLGDDIHGAADRAGYQSASMFTAMFRRTLGVTPGHYLRSEGFVREAISRP